MLSHFLTSELFAFFLIFCRMGSAFMLLPGFSEAYVAVRFRLIMALMVSLVLTPIIPMPEVPVQVPALFLMVLSEIIIGLFIGTLSKILIAAMQIAATIIAYESSLASALTVDLSQGGTQDTSLTNLLTFVAVVLIFVTDLHYLMLKAMADSYTLFPPGRFPPIADMADHASHTMNGAFTMALQLAAPNIVVGTMLYLGAGIISRLMPNVQIFFVMMAPQLLISFAVLMVIFSSVMMWYLDYFKDAFSSFLAP